MKKRLLSLLLAVLCVVPVLVLPLSAAGTSDSVKIENITDIHKSSPYDDLQKFSYSGATTVLTDRASIDARFSDIYIEASEPQLITLYEHGWGYVPEGGTMDYNRYFSEYNLYFYFYIPDNIKLDISADKLTISLAIAFDKNANGVPVSGAEAEKWTPTDYTNFDLQIVGGYEEGQKILKCKLKTPETLWNRFVYWENLFEHRRYDAASVFFPVEGYDERQPYEVGARFVCHYFRDGYNGDCADPYTVECSGIEVLKIEDLHQTYFRYPTGNPEIKTQITSVYFAIDESYFQKYTNTKGELDDSIQSIKSSWEEYHTSDIFVTSDDHLYQQYAGSPSAEEGGLGYAWNLLFHDLTTLDETPWRTVAHCTSQSIPLHSLENKVHYYDYFLGQPFDYFEDSPLGNLYLSSSGCEQVNYIAWWFKANGSWEKSREEIMAWYHDHEAQYKDLLLGQTVDPGRQLGYQEHVIYNENLTVMEYVKSDVFSEWFTGKNYDENIHKRIQVLDATEIGKLGGFADFVVAEKYWIEENDVADFRRFCAASAAADKRVVVFHFAETEYFTQGLEILTQDERTFHDLAYRSRQTLFLDFSVIYMSFWDSEKEYATIIPVSSDEIDIGGGVEAPPYMPSNPGDGGNKNKNLGGCANFDFSKYLTIVLFVAAGALLIFLVQNIVGAVIYFKAYQKYPGGIAGFIEGGGQVDKPPRVKTKKKKRWKKPQWLKPKKKQPYKKKNNYKRDRGGYKGKPRYNGRR